MLSQQEYQELRNKYDMYHSERERLFGNRNYTTPEDRELLPPSPSSDEISAIEIYEFVNTPPKVYFVYANEEKRIVTTWTGEKLGNCNFGKPFQSNFGDWRKPIWVNAINGKKYFGYFFFSTGDYCRIKELKN